MKALEKIKEMIDFCDAVGCHRAIYESIKLVEAELEAQQSNSCEECKWQDVSFPSNQFHCDECKHNYASYNDNFEPKGD